MGSIRNIPNKGLLFMDFRFQGRRLREYTLLTDTPANRKRLQKVLDQIEKEIALGSFDYQKTFNKPLPCVDEDNEGVAQQTAIPVGSSTPRAGSTAPSTPLFKDFAMTWYGESEVAWRRSYRVTQLGAINQYLIPHFGNREVGQITKADVLSFRASLAKVTVRNSQSTLSNRRINAVMKPLRQILNEAADRFEFTSGFTNVKPLRLKRSDVEPFTIDDVQRILKTCRVDYRNYFTVRFFTGMRSGEVHGLKWKYVDFERRLILVRESFVMGEDEDLKTDGSQRDIQMSQMVFDALKSQRLASDESAEYVFCNREHKPLNNKNFITRVWQPLLRHLNLTLRRPYQMRHTAATLWLASGEAPEWIARQLGHTSTEMLFRVYSRFVPNLTRRDGSAFERLLASRMGLDSGAAGVDVLPVLATRPTTEALPCLM
jgi:integrase